METESGSKRDDGTCNFKDGKIKDVKCELSQQGRRQGSFRDRDRKYPRKGGNQ